MVRQQAKRPVRAARSEVHPEARVPAENSSPSARVANDGANPQPERLPILGDVDGKPLRIDLGKLLATRLLIQAASGGGKSFALRRILEQTHGFVQQIVIDPEGELVTLAEKFDFMVCAPDSAVAPLRPESGGATADLIFRSGRSTILSLGEFEIEAMQEFVADFVKGLMRQPKELWRHCLVAIDEGAIFAPQADKAVSKKPMIDLSARGRKRGFCPIVATQRGSALLKGVAANLDNKLIGLTTLDVDVERAAEQLGMKATVAKERLRKLATGQFVAYGPALSYELVTVSVGPVVTRHGCLGAFGSAPYAPTQSIEEVQRELRGIASAKATEPGATGEAATSDTDSDLEVLRERVAVVRLAAIRPLLSKQRSAYGTVQARAQEIGVKTHDLRNWMNRYQPSQEIESLRPTRIRGGVRHQLAHMERVLLPRPVEAVVNQ